MASVPLSTLWLNNTANTSDYMSFPYMTAMAEAPAVGSTMVSDSDSSGSTTSPIRLYANGVLRYISTPGEQKVLTVTLPACTPTQMTWLYQHLAPVTLLVRNDRGRRFWAMYFTYTTTEHQYDANTDVALTLTETTFTDLV